VKPVVALRELEAWCQEELAAKQREERWLAELERALIGEESELVVARVEQLERSRRECAEREPRMQRARRALAAHLGLPVEACTLGSLAERSGDDGARLAKLRGELRAHVQRVSSRTKRVGTLARQQRRFLSEVLVELFGVDPGDSLTAGGETPCNGRLVDSRA
jgi:hypothetical protein